MFSKTIENKFHLNKCPSIVLLMITFGPGKTTIGKKCTQYFAE